MLSKHPSFSASLSWKLKSMSVRVLGYSETHFPSAISSPHCGPYWMFGCPQLVSSGPYLDLSIILLSQRAGRFNFSVMSSQHSPYD